MTTFSQSMQDLFVINSLKGKREGFFLEIGANHPVGSNNTYLLEKDYNWKGIMIEYNRTFEHEYKVYRPNSLVILDDARKIDYRNVLEKTSFPRNLDYLQIDLDVDNRSTLDVLELFDKTVFDNYHFATVTFEHDIYRGDYFNTREISRKIFEKRGYSLVFPDVKVLTENGQWNSYEDWYVYPDLVEDNYVRKFKTEDVLRPDEIIKRLKE